ncbi:MAG: hypothetical protein ACLSA6_04600 [Holdemania massiliensis]
MAAFVGRLDQGCTIEGSYGQEQRGGNRLFQGLADYARIEQLKDSESIPELSEGEPL